MTEEAQPYLDAADTAETETVVAGTTLRVLRFGERQIALVVGGIGLINAAHAATVAIAHYGTVVPIVSGGSGGGLSADARVGEVVIATTVVNIDADARVFGYERGQTPGMPARYSSDAALADAIFAGDHGQTVRRGAIGSGDSFVTSELAAEMRVAFPDVVAVDMESVAIAQVAAKYGNPFVAVRAISDLCAPDGTEFLTHIDDAAARSCNVVVG